MSNISSGLYISGSSVRNLQAFSILQTAFLKATTTLLCSVILDSISAVYHADSANYFILEPHSTLSTFAEKIHFKPIEIQVFTNYEIIAMLSDLLNLRKGRLTR